MTESILMGEPSKAVKAREANKRMNSEEAISGSCSGLAVREKVMQELRADGFLNCGISIRPEATLVG